MSRSRSSLQGWLKNAGLQRFYANFVEKGINEENFIHLQFGDYDDVGITDHADRQRLFKLIQVVRRQIEKPSGGASGSSSGDGGGGGGGGGGSVSESPPSTAQSDGGSSSHSSRRSSSPRKNRGSGIPKPKSKRASSGIPVSSRPKSASRRSKSPRPDDGGSSRLHAMKDVPEDEVPPRSASSPPGQVVQDASTSSKIRVVIRKRPLSKREKSRGEGDIITFEDDDINTVYVHEPKTKVDLTKYTEKHCFVFDESFDERATNELIYERTCLPLVDFFLNAGKVTCFAYGQTGAGKTYTMMGPEGGKTVQNGLYALAAQDIFASIEAYPQLALFVSFFEIYGGKLYDLLNNRNKLVCREDGSMKVNIVGVKEVQCRTADELMELMAVGNGTRSTGKTGANADSSRSHAILQMILKRADRKQKWRVHGKFSFIDLAGSERGADTSANSRQTRLEGAEINKSLLALKECIRALDQGAHHTPFRGSKLTQVLKDSFVGNSKTVMIAAVSPNGSSVEHTLNTLRYADRVKEMRKSSKSKSRSVDAYMPHAHAKRNVVEQYGDEDDEEEEDVPPEELPTLGVRHRPGHTSATVSEDQQRRDTGAGRSHMSDQRRRRVAEEEAKRRQEQQDDLERTHQELCESIVEIEDQIVDSHRRQIDSTMKLVKEEMQLLKQFDQQAFDVSDYVNALDMVLAQKVESIVSLREKIQLLHAYIQERDLLSSTLAPNNDDALDVVDVDADDFDLLGN